MKPKRKSVPESDKDSVQDVDFDFSSTNSDLEEDFDVLKLHRISQIIKLPGTMWGVHQKTGNKTAFIHINEDMVIDKTVEFDRSCLPSVKVNGASIVLPEVKSKKHLECLLRGVDAIKKFPVPGMSLRKRKLSDDSGKKSPRPSTSVNIVKKSRSSKRKIPKFEDTKSKSEDIKSLSSSESDNEDKKPSSPPLRITRSQIKNNTPKCAPRRGRSSNIQAVQTSSSNIQAVQTSDEETTLKNSNKKKIEAPVKKTRSSVQEKPKVEPSVESSSEDETPKITKTYKKREKDEVLGSFGVRCIIDSCTNSMLKTRKDGLNVSYYRFPMDDNLAEKWKSKCKLNGRIPKSARVCSDHFKKEDFEGCETPGSQMIKRELKRKAVPSLYVNNKKEPVLLPQKKIKRRKSEKSTPEIKIVSTKTLQYTSDIEEDEKNDSSRPPTPDSVASIDLTQQESDDEPIFVNDVIPTVELSDESSESDGFEEVIQVRITHMGAESSEESETDESVVVRKRKKILKKKKPIIEEYSDYEVETLEIELKSDDSDAEVRQLKKSLDVQLNASKPPIQNGLNQPKVNTVKRWTMPKISSDSIEFEAEVESEKIVSPPRQSQSLAKLLQGKNRPDKATIIKIIEQKISENYDILNNRRTPRMETKSDTIYINKNGKGNSLPKGIVKQIDQNNIPSQLNKITLPKVRILDPPPQPQTSTSEKNSTQLKLEKSTPQALETSTPRKLEKSPQKLENSTPQEVEKSNSSQFENIVAQLDLQIEDIEQKPEETTEASINENENANESFEFVNSNNIIIENTTENKVDDMPEIIDNNQIIIVCKNDEEISQVQERIGLQINHHEKEMPQTISIQRKSGNEVIFNKLKIPATEHTEGIKTEKGILNTLFWNNVTSENIFCTNEDLVKPEVQELLSNIPQNEIDYSKVIVLNNLEDQNVQWELSDAVKEQVQGNEFYYITQEESSTTEQVRNQSDSFDENQFLNMECLEVEVIPPEPSGNY